MKFYNQLDARPNRYALASANGLHRQVRRSSTFKLRFTRDASLRESDENISLKNRHTEWQLLRRGQALKVPKELWDRVVDSAAGRDAIGQQVPYTPYADYDERRAAASSVGLRQGQVMGSSSELVAIIKGTILDTRVTKYDSTLGQNVTDPLAYPGFDLMQLDTYLSSPTAVRSFLNDVWRFASAQHVNELFFEVLEDCLARTSELSGIFKTSFIALNDVRTVTA